MICYASRKSRRPKPAVIELGQLAIGVLLAAFASEGRARLPKQGESRAEVPPTLFIST